jgi:ribosomal protein S18 acetylase RimI-like enzyme
MQIRTAALADAASLTELWASAGLKFRPADVPAELQAVLARDPELAVLAEDADGLAAAVLGTFDGRRGWVNRLATRPDQRGHGHASSILAELERRLATQGCRKANLLTEPDNERGHRLLPAARIHRGSADLHGEVATAGHQRTASSPTRPLTP